MSLNYLSLPQKRQLVGFLELLCQELELTETQFQEAKQRYEAVGNWLDGGEIISMHGPRIIPQGSISLGTTVKPIGRDEFDIDLVCKLIFAGPDQGQAYIREIVGNRLRQNKIYASMLEPLKRGWRLNYAKSSRFHLDITPAVMNGLSLNGEIFVPDRELKQWKPSNPEGYVRWFESHSALEPEFVLEEMRRLTAEVAPLPEPTPFKGILKRTVQLLKRHRDVHFSNRDSDNAPISIIITTLAAKSYAKAIQATLYESQLDLLYNVISKMDRFIEVFEVDGCPFYYIPNETTKGENFAEKWNKHPQRAKAFYEWQRAAVKDLDQFGLQIGQDKARRAMMDMFGEKETTRGFDRYTDAVNRSRGAGSLRVNPISGLGIASGVQVQPNTHFGK